MYKLFFLFLFCIQTLTASWDQYEGEQLVLFSLAPGTGDQFARSSEEQKLPTYFRKIAETYPDIKAKIIAIDPYLSSDPTSDQYAFLKKWEHEGTIFKKGNIEIQFISEYIPEIDEENYTHRIKQYMLSVLENGGIVFIGHHGQAYYAFEPFRIAYNHLYNHQNIQMYISCANLPPTAPPKVYWNTPCSNEELKAFYESIEPYFSQFASFNSYEYTEAFYKLHDLNLDLDAFLMELNLHFNRYIIEHCEDIEACEHLFMNIIKNMDTSFQIYKDMFNLPYTARRSSDGSLRLELKENAVTLRDSMRE